MTQPGAPVAGRFGIGCLRTRAVRLEVEVYDPTSAADEARLRDFLAPFGDRVVFTRIAGPGPQLFGGAPRGGDVAARPSRAVLARRTRAGAAVRVTIACPRTATTACAGSVTIAARRRAGARRLATRAFAGLAPGRRRVVRFRLTAPQRAALRTGRLAVSLAPAAGG